MIGGLATRGTLHRTFLTWSVGFAVAFGVLTGWLSYRRGMRNLRTHTIRNAHLAIEMLRSNAGLPLVAGDDRELGRLCKTALAGSETFGELVILDEAGNEVVAVARGGGLTWERPPDAPYRGIPSQFREPIILEPAHFLDGALRLRPGGGDPSKVVGAVGLFIDFRPISSEARMALLENAGVAVLFILGFIIAGRVLERRLIRPLVQMGLVAQNMASGDYDQAIDTDQSLHEIGRLGTSFNQMASAIKARDERIRHSNEILERTVRERTAKLREREERYRSLVEAVPDIIVEIDVQGRIAWLNEGGEAFFGNDALGENAITLMVAPLSRDGADEMLEDILNDRRNLVRLDLRVVRHDGVERSMSLTARDLRDGTGTVTGVLATARDMTERVEAEEARRLLAAALEQAAESILITDRNGLVEYANHAAEAISGYSREQLLGRDIRSLAVSQEVTKDVYRRFLEALERGEVWSGRLESMREDAARYEAEVTFSPVRDEEGHVVNFVCVSRDVTDMVLLEAQLRHAQKMEAVGTLAGGIAHDFNNLLTPIIGHCGILRMVLPDNEEARESIEAISLAGERAAELTRQLLGYARKGKYRNVRVDLHDTINSVIRLLSRTVHKNITLSFRPSAANGVVRGDPGQMEQLLLNLAINARDAMPEGGQLTFATDVTALDEEYCARHSEATPGEYVCVSLTDTGCGIPREVQDRIFEPFFTTKGPAKGTGMGLATAYGIVHNHGGSIEVYSEVGQGTTFKVFLPLTEMSANDEATELEAQQPVQGTGTILVVDDEELVRQVAERMLEDFGYDVLLAADGKEGVSIFEERHEDISLVVLDMVMPSMGGREAFRAMRRIAPEVKAIAVTGYLLDGLAQQVVGEGMLGLTHKPFTPVEFSRDVATAIAARKHTMKGDRT